MSLRIKQVVRSDLEVKQMLDSHSPSLCLAKWYNATVWLGSGMTTSCHHPLPHLVDLEEVKRNPKALHNTRHKKHERWQMRNGERPPGCEYCWKVEDIGRDNISDRVYKSVIYNEDLLNAAVTLDPLDSDFNLRTLEIAFDRTCQFACSYCNPAFSTSWVRDLKQNGIYENLKTDGGGHYDHMHDAAGIYDHDPENPYVEAFFKWWESDLHKTLQELRVTGGEPLMSQGTWRLLDWFADAIKTDKYPEFNKKMRLAINSNLGAKDDLIDRFIEKAQHIPELDLYTSGEAMGAQAEYIRDGLEWDVWLDNIDKLHRSGALTRLHMMMTINLLCLESITEFLDLMMQMKHKYGRSFPTFTLNILRFPSFQSATVLPDEMRAQRRDRLQRWLDANRTDPLIHEMEINQVQRLIDYLDVVKTPHRDAYQRELLEKDFKVFYTQYDQRRNKDFCKTFPELAKWFKSIKVKKPKADKKTIVIVEEKPAPTTSTKPSNKTLWQIAKGL